MKGSVGSSDFFIFYFYLFIYWPHRVACGILVPRPGIEPKAMRVKAQSPNHWTTREFPRDSFYEMYCWVDIKARNPQKPKIK